MAVDGDSLLVLGQVALYQENVGSDIYKQRRNALALVIRDYLNSYRWRDVSELERAKHAALYIASGCTYDTGLYNRCLLYTSKGWWSSEEAIQNDREKIMQFLHSERYQYLFGLQIIFCREGMELKWI